MVYLILGDTIYNQSFCLLLIFAVLEEFFHLRLQFYEKRKVSLLMVIKADVIVELFEHNRMVSALLFCMQTALLLTLRSHLSKLENKVALMSGVLDSGVVDVNKLSTDLYIKAMSIITLVSRDSCPEMLQVLLADIDRINLKVKKLEGSTPRTLWLEELAALELELDVCIFIDLVSSFYFLTVHV